MLRPRLTHSSAIVALLGFLLAACGGDSGPNPHIAGTPAKLVATGGDHQSGVVGKELPAALVVQVLDSQNNPVQGQLINLRVTSGGGSMFSGSGLSNVDGLVQDRWTLGTSTSDSQQVEARAVDNVTGAAIVFAVFRATPLPDSAATVAKVSGDGQQGTSGVSLTDSLKVRVRDQYSNLVPGATVSWAVASGGGSISPVQSVTDASGLAASAWTPGPVVGLQAATATARGHSAAFTATTQAASTPSQTLIVSGEGQTGPTSTALPLPLVARVVDQNGINVAGVSVTWAAASGGGSVNPTSAVTDAQGQAQTTWTLGPTGGAQTVSATATGLAPILFHATGQAPVTFTAITAGGISLDEHTCALTNTGTAYCWGAGTYGRLGNGTTSSSNVPIAVSGGLQFTLISAGGYHTCGLTATGAAYCWGRNDRGQLGNGSLTDASTPQLVSGGLAFVDLDAGADHTCGIIGLGVTYCWGGNTYGELGDGTNADRASPTLVSGGIAFTSISAGGNTEAVHTCATTAGGTSYCWGAGGFGQLGVGTSDHNAPIQVTAASSLATTEAGGYHSCGRATGGAITCWGYSFYGQLSYTGPAGLQSVTVGGWTSCGIITNGDGYCWGWGRYGARGDGVDTEGPQNPSLAILGSHHWAQLSVGAYHTCGVTTAGEAYCFGYGADGQLGDGGNTFKLSPSRVVTP